MLYPRVPKDFLLRTCILESECKKAYSVHQIDTNMARLVHRRASAVGWLDPIHCPEHVETRGSSTRGNFGLIAAYHVRFLFPCAPYWLLDIPLVSAIAAARKVDKFCAYKERIGEGYECWPGRLRMLWAGGNKDAEKVIARFYGHTDSVITQFYFTKRGRMDKNRLREQRERSRLTVEEVSKLMGLSQSAISKYENGNTKLSYDRAVQFAKLYKVETHELFLKLPEADCECVDATGAKLDCEKCKGSGKG